MKLPAAMPAARAAANLACGALALLVLGGCVAEAPTAPVTTLKIVVREDGRNVSSESMLSCQQGRALASSSLPTAQAACTLLAEDPQLLTRTADPQRACTEIYGGPATADVTGSVAGREVIKHFDRSNGCAIDSWNRARALLGTASNYAP